MEHNFAISNSQTIEWPRFRWTHVVQLLLVLNLIDCCFTLVWVCGGYATEANTAMEVLLRLGPVEFALVKTALVMGGTYVLLLRRRRWLAQVGLSVATAAYLAVCLHHLRYLASLWA